MRLAKLAFEKTGCKSGKATGNLLCIHGLNSHKRVFDGMKGYLSEKMDVYCLDLRNHGDSEWKETMTYDEMMEDIIHLMNELEITKTSLLGHSLGGKIAMNLAGNYPERVARLGLIDIGPFAYWDFDEFPVTANNIIGLELLKKFKFEGKGIDEIRTIMKTMLKNNESKTKFVMNNIEQNPRSTLDYRWISNMRVINDTYQANTLFTIENNPPFNSPTLAMIGNRSEYINFRKLDLFKKHYPNVLIEEFEGDHFFFVEESQYERVKKVTKEFFEKDSIVTQQ